MSVQRPEPVPYADSPVALPDYASLPRAQSGGGARSGWGQFGEDDSVGLMNLLSKSAVAKAAQGVRTGEVFALDLPADFVSPPLFQRGAARLTQLERLPGHNFDDVRDNVYSQSGSQWDALSHVAYAENEFYNGATAAQIRAGERNTIEHWARRGIAARGVILDVSDVVAERGDPGQSIALTVDDLESAREKADVEIESGDILLLHTGFMAWYRDQPLEERTRLSFRDRISATGIEHSEAMAEYVWNLHIAGFATDTAGLEVMPPERGDESRPYGFLHRILIGQYGLAIGEQWWLADLMAAAHADGRYDFLLVSAPQHVPRAAGSPANAIAIR